MRLKIRTLTFVGEVEEDGGSGATFFLSRALSLVDPAEVGVSFSAAVAPHGGTVVASQRLCAAACVLLPPPLGRGEVEQRSAERPGPATMAARGAAPAFVVAAAVSCGFPSTLVGVERSA